MGTKYEQYNINTETFQQIQSCKNDLEMTYMIKANEWLDKLINFIYKIYINVNLYIGIFRWPIGMAVWW